MERIWRSGREEGLRLGRIQGSDGDKKNINKEKKKIAALRRR